MGGMRAHFWKRSEQAKKVRLESEALESMKDLRRAEKEFFAEDSKVTGDDLLKAELRMSDAADALLEIEGKRL